MGAMVQRVKTDSTTKYCAKWMDGLVTVSQDGKLIAQTLTLNNGTQISTTGTITKKDGSIFALKEGDCMNKEGELIEEKAKGK